MLSVDRVAVDALSPQQLLAAPVAQWLYMSPEQSGKTSRAIDARSDLYSLGTYA